MPHPSLIKTQVEVAAACGISIYKIAREFGIAKSTVWRWLVMGARRNNLLATAKWKKQNPDKNRVYFLKWYAKNEERVKEANRKRNKKRYKENPEQYIERSTVRRRIINGFELSAEEKRKCLEIRKEARRLTLETGIPHEVDHIWPISRGGPHAPWNLRVITRDENRKKGNKIDFMPKEWNTNDEEIP